MRSVARYRRFARQSRRLAAALSEPADKRALELMAQGWDKCAEKLEARQRCEEQQIQLAEADQVDPCDA
jgi:oligoendopeptidase F